MPTTIQYLHRRLKIEDPLCREQYNIYIDAWKQKTLCVTLVTNDVTHSRHSTHSIGDENCSRIGNYLLLLTPNKSIFHTFIDGIVLWICYWHWWYWWHWLDCIDCLCWHWEFSCIINTVGTFWIDIQSPLCVKGPIAHYTVEWHDLKAGLHDWFLDQNVRKLLCSRWKFMTVKSKTVNFLHFPTTKSLQQKFQVTQNISNTV